MRREVARALLLGLGIVPREPVISDFISLIDRFSVISDITIEAAADVATKLSSPDPLERKLARGVARHIRTRHPECNCIPEVIPKWLT